MTVHLSPSDISVVANDPRILDLRLGDALAFAQPRDIRKLIQRNLDEVQTYGEICATVAQITPDAESNPKGAGRPSQEYWLNEPQALLICMFARTSNAAEVRRALIAAFLEWRRRDGGAAAIRLTAPAAPAARPVAFDDDPQSASTFKLALVREARQLWGPARARALWQSVGLPLPGRPEPGDAADEAEGRACLAHLLARSTLHDRPQDGGPKERSLREEIEAALDGDEDCRVSLMFRGVRVEEREEGSGFWIPNRGAWVEQAFAGTRWAGGWRFVLKRLPGVEPAGPYNVEGVTTRGSRVPEAYLEPVSSCRP